MKNETSDMERHLIPAKTIVHVAGFPVEVEHDTIVVTAKANWLLIREAMEFPPTSLEPLPEPLVAQCGVHAYAPNSAGQCRGCGGVGIDSHWGHGA